MSETDGADGRMPAGPPPADPSGDARVERWSWWRDWYWLVLSVLLTVAGTGIAWFPPLTPNDETAWRYLFASPRSSSDIRLSVWMSPDGLRGWAVGVGETVLRTENAGATWTAHASGTPNALFSVQMSPDGLHGWVVGTVGTVLRTENAGATWTAQTSGTTSLLTSVQMSPDGLRGWAVGEDGTVLRTENAGATWTAQTSGTTNHLRSVQMSPDGLRGWAVGDKGTVLRTENAGATWTAQASGTTNHLRSVQMSPDGLRGWAVGFGGTVLRTENAGATWTAQTSGTGTTLYSVQMSPDGLRGWAVGFGGTVLRTENAGATWTAQTSGTSNWLTSVQMSPDGLRGWAVGERGTVLRMENAGATWTRVYLGTNPPLIAWVLWISAIPVGLVPSIRRRRVFQEVRVRITELLASDGELTEARMDASSTTARAGQISAFLRNRMTRPPFTVAVTGGWGTGKSSLLNLLHQDLAKNKARTVWFNAWHHQKEEHLFAALLEAVRKDAMPPFFSLEGVAIRWSLFAGYLREHWLPLGLIFLAACFFATWTYRTWPAEWGSPGQAVSALRGLLPSTPPPCPRLDSLSNLCTVDVGKKVPEGGGSTLVAALGALAASIKLLAEAIKALGDRLKPLNPGKLLAAIAGAAKPKALGDQLGFRSKFREALKDITDALEDWSLTIIVDDLDRCRPEQVVDVLEAVNFLSTSGGCFVVLGISLEQVTNAVGLAYEKLAKEMGQRGELAGDSELEWRRSFATRYISKLVNLSVSVPTFGVDAAKKLLTTNAQTKAPPTRWERWRGAVFAGATVAIALVGIGLGTLPTVHVASPAAERATSVVAASSQASPAPGPQAAAVPQASALSATTAAPFPVVGRWFVSGPTISWVEIAAAVGVLGGLTGLYVLVLRIRRARESTQYVDRAEFGEALDLWTDAAFSVHSTPRELKRFLNQARFVAAALRDDNGEPVPGTEALADGSAVAFTALAHLNEDIVRDVADGKRDARSSLLLRGGRGLRDGQADALGTADLYRKAFDAHAEKYGAATVTPDAAQQWLKLAGNTQIV